MTGKGENSEGLTRTCSEHHVQVLSRKCR